jgi:hypothetical protein
LGGLAKRLRIYLVGGATAVLLGWRETTIDIDLKLVPEVNEILKALPEIKEALEINVELASPDDFIPAVPGWEERSEQKLSQIEPLLKKSSASLRPSPKRFLESCWFVRTIPFRHLRILI